MVEVEGHRKKGEDAREERKDGCEGQADRQGVKGGKAEKKEELKKKKKKKKNERTMAQFGRSRVAEFICTFFTRASINLSYKELLPDQISQLAQRRSLICYQEDIDISPDSVHVLADILSFTENVCRPKTSISHARIYTSDNVSYKRRGKTYTRLAARRSYACAATITHSSARICKRSRVFR